MKNEIATSGHLREGSHNVLVQMDNGWTRRGTRGFGFWGCWSAGEEDEYRGVGLGNVHVVYYIVNRVYGKLDIVQVGVVSN